MQIESGHRRGSRGAAPPLPLRAPLELSRELVVGASGAAGRCGRGAGSSLTLAALSASLAAQDGRHLARRAHPEARDGDQGTVSGLGLYSGARGARGFVGFGGGGGGREGSRPRGAACSRPPASAALLIGRAARAHPPASPLLITGPREAQLRAGRGLGSAGPSCLGSGSGAAHGGAVSARALRPSELRGRKLSGRDRSPDPVLQALLSHCGYL